VPAGALQRATELSLQSITNIAPNGRGNGVRIGPANLTFESPVSVSISYPVTQADSSSAEVIGIVRQDSTGAWFAFTASTETATAQSGRATPASLRQTTAAPAAASVSARTRKTGDHVPGRLWIFEPKAATVTTNGTVALSVLACHDELFCFDKGTDDELCSLGQMTQVCVPSIRTPTWSVNGIVRGNATVGEVAPGAPTTATYRAPAAVPSPATVSATVALFWPERGVTKTFTSHITIIDSDIKLRVIGAYVNPEIDTNNGDGRLPSSIEDRVTLDLILAGDASALRSFTIVDNPVATIVRDGGFRDSPFYCKAPQTVGTFEYIKFDPELAIPAAPTRPGGGLVLAFTGDTSLFGVTYFIGAEDGCREVPLDPPLTPKNAALLTLPPLPGLPGVGQSINIDDRQSGAGWFWIVTRLANQ